MQPATEPTVQALVLAVQALTSAIQRLDTTIKNDMNDRAARRSAVPYAD